MKPRNLVSLGFSLGVLALAVACTKTTTRVIPGDDAGAGKTKDGGVSTVPSENEPPVGDDDDDDATSSSSSSSSGSTSSGGVPTVDQCHTKANQNACGMCCQQISQKGYQVYALAQHDCECKAANCADTCKASYCAATPSNPPNPSDCVTCLNGHVQGCNTDVANACNADPDGKVFYNCVQTACAGLPTQ